MTTKRKKFEDAKPGDLVLISSLSSYKHDRIRGVQRVTKQYVYLDDGSIWNKTTGYRKGDNHSQPAKASIATQEDIDANRRRYLANMLQSHIDRLTIDIDVAKRLNADTLNEYINDVVNLRLKFERITK